ncbi:substrate-binding periplasmic protein [Dongshaea marina]|uniref:substrate-binding periplasmic protein n=1 Tax=Dongshaea marina TaxID=2047966 RepID=UPI000D3E091B|nr:transporter substrate-binding domain-containing protein [Dongshaea marina]
MLHRLLLGSLLFVFSMAALGLDRLVLGSPVSSLSKASANVLVEAYSRLGIQLQIKQLPAERSLALSNQGALDGEVNRIKGLEQRYPNLVRVPVVVNHFEAVVVAQDPALEVSGLQSLKNYRIGIRNGIKYAEDLTRGMNVKRAMSNQQLFSNLALGKVDLIIVTRSDASDYLATHPQSPVKIIGPPLLTKKLYHYLNRKHRELLPQITKQLQKMQEQGSIEAIRRQALQKPFN